MPPQAVRPRRPSMRIHELNGIMSDYDPESELCRLCRNSKEGKSVPVGDDLWRVLVHAQDLSAKTGGEFDITVGPVVHLWRDARITKEMPSRQALEKALSRVGYRSIHLDAEPKRGIAQARHATRPGRNRQGLCLGGGLQGFEEGGDRSGARRGRRRHAAGRAAAREARLAHRHRFARPPQPAAILSLALARGRGHFGRYVAVRYYRRQALFAHRRSKDRIGSDRSQPGNRSGSRRHDGRRPLHRRERSRPRKRIAIHRKHSPRGGLFYARPRKARSKQSPRNAGKTCPSPKKNNQLHSHRAM